MSEAGGAGGVSGTGGVGGAELTVVGIGADGWAGLTEPARAAVLGADEVVGSRRQLALLPRGRAGPAALREWPSPMGPLVRELAARPAGRVCVLASGDPMLHGIGATLARWVTPERLTVITHPSAFALACGRLGWAAADVEVVSAVTAPVQAVVRSLQPGRRIVVYLTGSDGATRLARAVTDGGYGDSRLVVLEQLGGPGERVSETPASAWGDRPVDELHVVAVECVRGRGAELHPRVPGLPDTAYETDGQLTKRHVRAVTLAALAPIPGALLWDVGAGSGSIGIEWCRAEPTARAIAVERDPERAERARRNALALGAVGMSVVDGTAPAALAALPAPAAVFVGGGLSDGVLTCCWDRLADDGRIVANAVTLEGEHALVAAREAHGGGLTRIEIAHAEPIGGFTGWRSQMPVTQWQAEKTREPATKAPAG